MQRPDEALHARDSQLSSLGEPNLNRQTRRRNGRNEIVNPLSRHIDAPVDVVLGPRFGLRHLLHLAEFLAAGGWSGFVQEDQTRTALGCPMECGIAASPPSSDLLETGFLVPE